jgi:hypothetical protein
MFISYNGELGDLCSTSSVIRMVKLWKVQWAKHVVWLGRQKYIIEIDRGKTLLRAVRFEHLKVDGW